MILSRYDGSYHIGALLGTAVSDPVLQKFGFLGNYTILMCCNVFVVLWITFYIKDPPLPDAGCRAEDEDASSTPEQPSLRDKVIAVRDQLRLQTKEQGRC